MGAYMGSCVPSRDIPRYIELFKAGKLADVPPTWHIAAAWALAHGASALTKSGFYTQFVGDPEPFLDFLLNVAVRMGNKRVLGPAK